VTVSEGLERTEPQRTGLAPSTWGTGKDLSTWDSPGVGHMAVAARRSELRTVAATAGHARPRAALERAARELLALQASDWAFMATHKLAGDYPRERLERHGADLDAALSALAGSPAEGGPAEPDRPSDAGGGAMSSKGGAGSPAEVISPPVPEPALRNLAPDLDLAALTSP
jgi:Domain of unknown function (DUF1957)